MSGNNSLSDSGVDLPSHYALRVALQTMKERCVALQERLLVVEEENSILRNQTPSNLPIPELNILRGCQSEAEKLRREVEELNRQKLKLTEHIAMVATENRQLWSRLSQLANEDKEKLQSKQRNQISIVPKSKTAVEKEQSVHSSRQNLIRSRTFTQHSPNPLLRKKHLSAATVDDLSLEEISLKDIDKCDNVDNAKEVLDYINNSDPKCQDIPKENARNCLGFGYLNDDSSDGGSAGNDDIASDTKKCIDDMMDIKKDLLKQQNELTALINLLKEKKVNLQECIECKRRSDKPEMADKVFETKDDLCEKTENSKSAFTASGNNFSSTATINYNKLKGIDNEENLRIDFLEEKKRASEMDKMCPMCGKIFNNKISFEEFQEHVETHFRDDSDYEQCALDRNFEFVSHTVGNF